MRRTLVKWVLLPLLPLAIYALGGLGEALVAALTLATLSLAFSRGRRKIKMVTRIIA